MVFFSLSYIIHLNREYKCQSYILSVNVCQQYVGTWEMYVQFFFF